MRAELPRRGGLPIKRAREIASGTDGLWTLLWRERDSNSRSLWRGKLLPAEEKGPEVDQVVSKGQSLLARDQWFESLSLQQGVWCEPDFRGRIPSMTVGDFARAR